MPSRHDRNAVRAPACLAARVSGWGLAAIVGATVCAAACSRSSLQTAHGNRPSGAGGAGDGGSASAGAGGQAGGCCAVLVPDGEPIGATPFPLPLSAPALAPLPPGLAVVERDDASGALSFEPLSAWTANWPLTLGAAQDTGQAAASFVVGTGLGGPALLAAAPPLGVFLAGPEAFGASGTWQQIAWGTYEPALVAALPQSWLAGLGSSAGSLVSLGLCEVQPDLSTGCDWDVACALGGRLPAAAAPVDGAVIAGVASGKDWGGCPDPDMPGPPTRLHVVRVEGAHALSLGATLVTGEPIAHVEVVSRVGGAWVVYQTDGSTSEQPPAVLAQRVDATGLLVGEPTAAVPDGECEGIFAAAPFGDGLVVAWLRPAGAPGLGVRVIEQSGSLGPGGALDLPGPLSHDRIGVAASPTADAVVVVFGAPPPGASETVYAARLACGC